METPKPVPGPDIFEVLQCLASRFWKSERRFERDVAPLDGEIQKLRSELQWTMDAVERTRLENRRSRLIEQRVDMEDAREKHPWYAARTWCASKTGFSSDSIYEAARAQFDASELQSDSKLKPDFLKLHEKLANLPDSWRTTSWAREFFDSGGPTVQQEASPTEPESCKPDECSAAKSPSPLVESGIAEASRGTAQEEMGKDIPDENGFVDSPVDPTAYVRQVDVLAHHTPVELRYTDKELKKIVENGKNCVRWTRPKNPEGIPIFNRRQIHLGDWSEYIKRQTATESDGAPYVPPGELASRTADVRATKTKGGSRDATSRLLSDIGDGEKQ